MKIQQQDLYYGAVLQQIAEYPVVTKVNKVTDKTGLYQLDRYTRFLIKYSTAVGPTWHFTISPDDLAQRETWSFFLIFNCGNDSVCMLDTEQAAAVLDWNARGQQNVRIWYEGGTRIRVAGPVGQLGHTIAHNAFPGALLGVVTPRQEPYAWPESCELSFFSDVPNLVYSSTDRRLDLVDTFGDLADHGEASFYMAVQTLSHKWNEWSDENLTRIENQIKYDFGFDAMKVKVKRVTDVKKLYGPRRMPGTDRCLWKITIKN